MPDISKCQGKKCNKKEQCYRFMAIPDLYQSYSNFETQCLPENEYIYFLELR